MSKQAVLLTKPQIEHLLQAATSMLAGEVGVGDSQGMKAAVLDRAVRALWHPVPAPKKERRTTKKSDTDFYHGMIACLAVVNLYGQDTLFDEIVGTANADELIKAARRNGDMRWSGLSRYVRRKREADLQ